ncbi:uncharacterized protein PRCAT00006184001 [Priceomyces carsonii]|uniref:uncharacterized protein n=1 Tax=Priceomyces carsonii TaxID=28549 RepID=UPI002ED7C129|nr:unnamed protein product [Priceomyces carsonii]
MFSILDSGRSGLLEFFFELISRIGNDYEFSFIIGSVEKAKYLMVTFAWFDTLCSLVSFPPRKVFSNKRLFSATDNEGNNIIETISGCPGKIFSRLVDISNLRYCSKNGKAATKFEVDRITKSLLNYRSYLTCAKDKSYLYKLKAANCWALAGLTVIEKLKQFKDDDLKQEVITGYIFEFIDSYKDLELVELKLQMAWPVFTLGLESRKMHQRVLFKEFLSFHYSMSKMANVEVMNNILTQSWETGASFEGIMKTKHWSGSGIALIPT